MLAASGWVDRNNYGRGHHGTNEPEEGGWFMSSDQERPDTNIPQDPGIPGSKATEELPPREKSHIERVPDMGSPDFDDEGHMAPLLNKS